MRGASRRSLEKTLPSNSLPLRISAVSYGFLSMSLRKSLRNGSWSSISSTQKALYRCALWIAKTRGGIVNKTLVAQVLSIVQCFFQSIRSRITAVGRKRAENMMKICSGIFRWAPQLKDWMRDANYIFYLGVIQQQ
jgi:hypothetical protein